MPHYKKIALTFISLAALSGCSVTPERLDANTVLDAALEDRALIARSQEPIEGRLTLHEAMARALKYNLEHRVRLMETALANSNFELAKMDMAPLLQLGAGVNHRSNRNGSSSEDYYTREESLRDSVSEDQTLRTADVRFAWNALDFGVSYLQAKQEANRLLITERNRRKVMLQLMQRVRAAYWRAAVMQHISGSVNTMMADANSALDNLRKVRAEQLRAPLMTLRDYRALLAVVQQLQQMQQSVNAAQVELAMLINMPPGTALELDVADAFPTLPEVQEDLAALELVALQNSGEYVSELYNLRNDQLEARKAFLRLLPSLEFSYGLNYSSNSFLVNDHWQRAGIQVSWDIMRLLSKDKFDAQTEARDDLALARRLVVNMGVVAQTHLSWQEYQNTLARLSRASEMDDIDQEIARLTLHAGASRALDGAQGIQSRAKALNSNLGRMIAYAEAQEAFGTLLQSLGLNPVPDDYGMHSVDELAAKLKEQMGLWDQGRLPAGAPEVISTSKS